MKAAGALLFAATLMIAPPAVGHDAKAVHGGRIVDAGTSHHLELVVERDRVLVFVSDGSGNAIVPKGFRGAAILSSNGRAQRIQLEATDAPHLSGAPKDALSPDATGLIQLVGPDGKTIHGQFK
jgi:hypothetical protein